MKTLYDILVCVEFHLESIGFPWKLINDNIFKDVKYTLDNMMKLCTSQGIGISVRKIEFCHFMIGKSSALCIGKEHHAL